MEKEVLIYITLKPYNEIRSIFIDFSLPQIFFVINICDISSFLMKCSMLKTNLCCILNYLISILLSTLEYHKKN
jgi:hypothetical protein